MARLLRAIGIGSARHRLIIIFSWVALALIVGVAALTGMKFSTGGFDIPGTESSAALQIVEDEFPQSDAPAGGTLQFVAVAPEGQTLTDPANATQLASWLASVDSLPHVASVTNPLDPTAPYISPDQTAAVATVTYNDITEEQAEVASEELLQIADQARDEGFTAEIGGSLANPVPEILGPSELVGAAIAFGVLLLTFGSLRAAGANMISAIAGVAVGVLGILAASAFAPIGSTTPILAVMLGLAVGIDYGLFILARHRAELRAGRTVEEAIGYATGTAGTAVVFAGVTVMIALVALSVVNIPFITEMGLAGAAGVLVAVLASLTLLPAMLSYAGKRVLPKKEHSRRTPAASDSRRVNFLERWVATVVKRPVVSIIGVIVLLGVASVPVLSLSTSLSTPGGENADSSQRRAYDIIGDAFGEGSQSPMIVLVDGSGVSSKSADVQRYLEGLDGVSMVVPAGTTTGDDYSLFSVIPTNGPVDSSTKALVTEIRDGAEAVAGVTMTVTGETAIGIDIDGRLASALIVYLALVAGLSIVLLILLFRSLIVPLAATIGFLFSLGAALGSTIAVFQWGWLDQIFPSPQGNPLLSLLPILVVGILFGLAMDYQVFLVSRIHEAHSRGLPAREAIIDGFGRSAFVVVAAAAIMFAVFGGFAFSGSSLVASIALALAVGVVADAFFVRMIFMPAVLSLTGRAAWWIPKWLDRVLPNIDAEGASLEAHEPAAQKRELVGQR
jgi:RND superfamily putative drug exporter